jgi:FkbM family methyltransferase
MQHSYPFDLSAPVVSADVLVTGDSNDMAIDLGSPGWAYGCSFLPSRTVPQACNVELELQVLSGALQIAVLPASGRYFFDEAAVSPKAEWQKISLRVPAFSDRGTLILRNGANGPSRLRLRAGNLSDWHPEAADISELQAIEALLTAADRFLAAKPEASLLSGNAKIAVQSALEPIVERLGLRAIAPGNAEFSDWLAALTDSNLIALAQSMAIPANSYPTPGWSFDWAENQPDPRWQLRSAVWRAMKQRCPDAAIELPWLANTKLRMPLGSDLSRPLFTLGQFEPNIFQLLSSMLRPGDMFIDVGANEGVYSLFAASVVGPQGLVVAIEPSARERGRLVSNMALNGVNDRIIIVDAALSSEAGWAEFSVAESEHGGLNAFSHQFSSQITASELRQTATLTLDMLAQRLPDRIPDFVKIDVEGAEYDVLRGADWVIDHARPIWFIEIGRTGAAGDTDVIGRLGNSDYALFSVDDALGGAARLSLQADWSSVENMIAVPTEKLAARWPAAPTE